MLVLSFEQQGHATKQEATETKEQYKERKEIKGEADLEMRGKSVYDHGGAKTR